MVVFRLFVYTLSFFALASVCEAGFPSDANSYPLCRVPLLIGEVPNKPFVAQIATDAWEVGSDGVKRPAPPDKQLSGIVARDKTGRVMVKIDVLHPQPQHARWYEDICDPKALTITSFSSFDRRDATVRSQRKPNGKQLTAGTTELLLGWHLEAGGREFLGEESVEGLPAFHFRASRDDPQRVLLDVINSDDLLAQLAEIQWSPFPAHAQEWKLFNIQRVEPAKRLMEVPISLANSLLPPSMVPAQMFGPNGCPPSVCVP